MKCCKISLFLALLVAACLPSFGQASLRVDVPFNFVASGKSLPAGHYIVWRQTSSVTNPATIWFLSDNHNTVMMSTMADSSQKAHHPSLVFLRAGGAYSLIQIWNGQSGVDVPQWNVKQTLVSKNEPKSDKYVEIPAE
jgi:hypothetical protein